MTKFVIFAISTLLLVSSGCAPRVGPRFTASTQLSSVSELAQRRSAAVATLKQYRENRQYSSDEKGAPASVFRDAQGRHCPMAEIIVRSGHRDLVDRVVKTNNRLRLASVRDGELAGWMATSGRTRDEIIEIQGVADLSNMLRFMETSPTEQQRLMAERLADIEQQLLAASETSLARLAAELPRGAYGATARAAHVQARQ